jgi:endoglucanase
MNMVADWARKQNRPVLLGEFGAGNQAELESRARYFHFIAKEAEKNNFSWAFFNFVVGFSLYDEARQTWNSVLLDALIQK